MQQMSHYIHISEYYKKLKHTNRVCPRFWVFSKSVYIRKHVTLFKNHKAPIKFVTRNTQTVTAMFNCPQ